MKTLSIQRRHGLWAEELAVEVALKAGMEIEARNWRYKRAEIDIIARDNGILVFIEVKSRSGSGFGTAAEMVTARKQRLIIDAAQAYMRATGYDWEIRFDIIAISGKPEQIREVRHIRDAFFPGLGYAS